MRLAATTLLLLASTVAFAQDADLVVRGGKIVTVDADFQIVDAMAIQQGRIVAIGTAAEIESKIGPETRIVELKGRMVLPGLIDSHVHPSSASTYEADHEIPQMDSIADVLDYVRGRAKVVPKGEWIHLSQVFITRLREQRYPTRAELDSVAPEHPVSFRTGPDGSTNSLGLKENGIDKAFAAKHPDNVMVDSATGEPNGILRQAATVFESKPDPSAKKLSVSDRDDRLEMLFDDYSRWGITGIIDRNCSDSARSQYARLLKSNRLRIRVRLSRSLNPQGDFAEIEERLDAIASDPFCVDPDPRLGVIGVKVFEDGGMLTGSAFFNQPWGISTIYGIEDPRYRGMQFIDEQRIEALVGACAKRKLAFTAHCQGDAAVETLMRAYKKVNQEIPIGPTRSTLTHSSFMSKQSIEDAAELGIGVDLQPAWLYLDARTLVAQFGEERLQYFIPLRSLFEAGVKSGGGSDHMQKIGSLRSVNPYNPFLGMWIAVTRTARWHDQPIHPEQALTREQMIRFYTINNAWLMRAEKEIGSLEPGKRADFIIIDNDLLACSEDQIRETQVQSTWLDGEKLFPSQ
ncbi:amidohydrolase [Stieleria sp. TO1_6]|uniref:amidohydrolase n=1 Tax=Stieleria tagensis TaxID=2956795 RepID=UPI00209B6950|nr:amidohydrolase [Stieleria tagensis]MCO8121254.1 amidohydrolase [Stieleria tagensis]